MENQTAQDVAKVASEGSPSSVSPADVKIEGQTAPSGVKDVGQSSGQNNLPFGEHPAWKEFQKRSEREKTKLRQEVEQMRVQYAEQKAYVDAMRNQVNQVSQGNSIAPQDLEALRTIFKASMSTPEIKQMIIDGLGLGEFSKLKEQVGELSTSWHGSQFKAELKQVKDYVKSIGLEADEIEDEIKEAIEDDPVYSQIGYQPGAVQAIFRNLYWDRVGELRERADNKKKIEERDALKRGQTQMTSESQTSKGKGFSKDPAERWKQLVQEAGGMGNIDFAR